MQFKHSGITDPSRRQALDEFQQSNGEGRDQFFRCVLTTHYPDMSTAFPSFASAEEAQRSPASHFMDTHTKTLLGQKIVHILVSGEGEERRNPNPGVL